MLLAMGVIAVEGGREERKYSGRYARFGVRAFTGIFIVLLALSALSVVLASGEFIGEGASQYITSIKDQIADK